MLVEFEMLELEGRKGEFWGVFKMWEPSQL